MTVHYLGSEATPQFVGCLMSLPNLHTLEIGLSEAGSSACLLERALVWQVVLPQIKTLIIPETAYPLLKHCPNVKDVAWVIMDQPITSDAFLRSLPPSWCSRVKWLMTPLVLPMDPSHK